MSLEDASASAVVELEQLRLPAAIAFARFLTGPDVNGSAELIRLHQDDDGELVVFSIEVSLPQHPLAGIRENELIGVIFIAGREPVVISLREVGSPGTELEFAL